MEPVRYLGTHWVIMPDEVPVPEKTFEEKVEVFIAEYLRCGNGAEAARKAGWSENRARKTASELLKRPEIAARIKEHDRIEKKILTDAEEDIESLLETDIPKAYRYLASKSMDDPDTAAKFIQLAMKIQSKKDEVLKSYDGYSTGEIINLIDTTIAETQELKARALEEIREATVC